MKWLLWSPVNSFHGDCVDCAGTVLLVCGVVPGHMRVAELTTDEQWDAAVPVLRQLWSHEDEAFVRGFRDEDDYRAFGLYDDVDGVGERDTDELVAVAGVSIQRVLHHRRHAWIHDLVVDEPLRGQGYGTALLAWLEDWARDRDCEYVALANVLDNDEGLAFYEREGMERWGYVVEKRLDGD